MDFNGAKKYALDRLRKELPDNLYYHHVHHTKDVCKAIEEIAEAEGVNSEELTLLKTAGLFHDIGFIEKYHDNEHIAASIAKEVLPKFDYTEEQISVIEGLILATRIPQKPQNHLEKIICDADLDYLGREDFREVSNSLMKEWRAQGLIEDEKDFNEKQIKFFKNHHYFTESARKKRGDLKRKHFAEIEKLAFK